MGVNTPAKMLMRRKLKTSSESVLLMLKKVILTSVKRVRQTLFKTVMIGLETTAVGFCRKGERSSLSPDTTKRSRDSQPSGRVGKGSVDGKGR